MKMRFAIAGAFIFACAGSAYAQAPKLNCAQFNHNPNGSWSPTVPVTISGPNGSVQIGPGASFNPGAVMAGLDLAALLNEQCK